MISIDILQRLLNSFDNRISTDIVNCLLSPYHYSPAILSSPFQEQCIFLSFSLIRIVEEIIVMIDNRMYNLLSKGQTFPYARFYHTMMIYYPSQEAWMERVKNPYPYIQTYLSEMQRLRNVSLDKKQKYIDDILQCSSTTASHPDLFVNSVLKILQNTIHEEIWMTCCR